MMPCCELLANNMLDVCTTEQLHCGLVEGSVLVLDCRSQEEFSSSHVDSAVNVTIPSLMLRRLKKGNLTVSSVIHCKEAKEMFNKKCKTHNIVLYDDSKETNVSQNNIKCLLGQKLKEDGCQTEILEGGFSTFQARYPEYCHRQDDSDSDTDTILGLKALQISEDAPDSGIGSLSTQFPVEVMPYLYLGNAKTSADRETLAKYGIRYILNVTPNMPNVFEDDDEIAYKRIAITDHWSQNLSVHFPQAIKFIEEARTKHVGVLVHCLAGISRSVTVTVAYLMARLSLSLNDAYDYVKKCKSNISPNFNFMGQLLDFERQLAGGRSLKQCTCDNQATEAICSCCDTKMYFMTPTKATSYSFDLELRS